MSHHPTDTELGFALFRTPVGTCGIAWCDALVTATHLPEATEDVTRAKLAQRAGGGIEAAAPPHIQRAIDAIVALLEGAVADLDFISCDMQRVDPFEARVYEHTRTIAPGQTKTYGEIATALGDKNLSRVVGRALGRNLWPIVIPCHRVIGASGKLTGFSATGGLATKLQLLAIEKARLGHEPGLFDDLPMALGPGGRGNSKPNS